MADRKIHLIRKIFRQWRVQAYLDFMWMTRDFKFCIINIVSDIILNLSGVAAVFLLAERFQGIGTWSTKQIVFMLGYAALVHGVMDMGFSYNIMHISRRIGRGQLDHILIQPQPIWTALLTEGFMPFSGSWSFLTGVGITFWALTQIELSITFIWCLYFALNLLSSCAVVLGFSYLWGSLAFWAPVGAEEINSQTTRFVSQHRTFPLDGLGKRLQNGLLSILPVGFVAWYPSRALMHITSSETLWHTPIAALIFMILATLAFKKGLNYYEQTGSQRYLGWGHRG